MKKTAVLASLLLLLSMTSCTRTSETIAGLKSKWEELKTLWGSDADGMLASEGFYGPLDEEFVPLEEEDLQLQFAEAAAPQPREIPGSVGGRVPSLNLFTKAMGELARIFQTVHFNTDDYILRKAEFVSVIDRVSDYLKKHKETYICVGGHCDERGSEAYNLALGTRRANYVRSLLIQRGVSPNQIHSVSYGKEQPADFGHNPTSWSKNRRVEFKIFEQK